MPNLTDLLYAEGPIRKAYVVYDTIEKKITVFRSGQRTNMTSDRAMIKCPPTFGKDVVCWQCMGLTAR